MRMKRKIPTWRKVPTFHSSRQLTEIDLGPCSVNGTAYSTYSNPNVVPAQNRAWLNQWLCLAGPKRPRSKSEVTNNAFWPIPVIGQPLEDSESGGKLWKGNELKLKQSLDELPNNQYKLRAALPHEGLRQLLNLFGKGRGKHQRHPPLPVSELHMNLDLSRIEEKPNCTIPVQDQKNHFLSQVLPQHRPPKDPTASKGLVKRNEMQDPFTCNFQQCDCGASPSLPWRRHILGTEITQFTMCNVIRSKAVFVVANEALQQHEGVPQTRLRLCG